MFTTGKEKYFQQKEEYKTINSALDEIETALGKIDGNQSATAERIFSLMDEIVEQEKSSRKDEKIKYQTQLDYVSKRIYSSAKLLVKTIGGPSVLREKRKKLGVGSDHWWWYLDQYLDDQRKKGIKRAGLIGLVAVLVLAAAAIIYDKFIAPPPEVRARLDYETKIDNYIAEGDNANALVVMESALEIAPDYYPLWIKKGVLEKVLGNDAEAQSSFDTAQQLVDNLEYFYYERAEVFMQFGLYDDVLADAKHLLELNAQSAEAYFFRGMVYEERAENAQARAAYEKAAALAEEQNKMQLVATIRVRLGMLMQSAAIPTLEE